MNKAILAGLALMLVRDCELVGSRPAGGTIKGTWGGDNAGLIADDSSAHVQRTCTWALESSAMRPALSPPHVPLIVPPAGRDPTSSQSRTSIRARPARMALFMGASQNYLGKGAARHSRPRDLRWSKLIRPSPTWG